jgi:hypothetical protein
MPGKLLSAIGVLATALNAQTLEKLLPPGAKIVETADVSAVASKPRTLVLWMVHPSRHVREPGPVYCGDLINGDYWEGPTRLSLVSSATATLINTILIKTLSYDENDNEKLDDTFQVPFFLPNEYYHVPHPNGRKEGKPQILYLKDFTGEGYAGQFPLFIYEHCGDGNPSALFGYSRVLDRALQYPVVFVETGEKPSFATWVEAIFAAKPIRPGRWKFTWGPGHGDDDIIDEDVTFDSAKQRFVDKRKITTPK